MPAKKKKTEKPVEKLPLRHDRLVISKDAGSSYIPNDRFIYVAHDAFYKLLKSFQGEEDYYGFQGAMYLLNGVARSGSDLSLCEKWCGVSTVVPADQVELPTDKTVYIVDCNRPIDGLLEQSYEGGNLVIERRYSGDAVGVFLKNYVNDSNKRHHNGVMGVYEERSYARGDVDDPSRITHMTSLMHVAKTAEEIKGTQPIEVQHEITLSTFSAGLAGKDGWKTTTVFSVPGFDGLTTLGYKGAQSATRDLLHAKMKPLEKMPDPILDLPGYLAECIEKAKNAKTKA